MLGAMSLILQAQCMETKQLPQMQGVPNVFFAWPDESSGQEGV